MQFIRGSTFQTIENYFDSVDAEKRTGQRRISKWNTFLEVSKGEFNARFAQTTYEKDVTADDFLMGRTLGKGAFGRVVLGQNKKNGVQYAVKLLKKDFLVKNHQVKHARNEKQILKSIRFNFLVHMEYFIQDNVYLYFVLTLVEAGELFMLLRKKGKFDEDLSRFYGAQVLMALEYLHYLSLIYRDIKPENILLDGQGYLKVTDFGFCKRLNDRTYTFCGTPEYIAPEMLAPRGYGKSVDYWSFGILLYEFNAGFTPFYAKDHMKIYEKILAGHYQLQKNFSSDLKDILKHLLETDITRRYGILKGGIDDIKDHRWFRSITWLSLVNKEVKPPFVYASHGTIKMELFEKWSDEPLDTKPTDPYEKDFADF